MVVGDHFRAHVEDLLYEHRVNLVLVRYTAIIRDNRSVYPDTLSYLTILRCMHAMI